MEYICFIFLIWCYFDIEVYCLLFEEEGNELELEDFFELIC